MKFKFQIACLDKKNYIEGFKDFNWNDLQSGKMIDYILKMVTDLKVNKIEIVRWNDKNERE